MQEETTFVTAPESNTGSPGANDPLEALISEIGATYPLMVYTSQSSESDEVEAVNAAILAGLVSP